MLKLDCTQCLLKGNTMNEDGRCHSATIFCVDCEESFCKNCYENSHHLGNRKNHKIKMIPKCNECTKWNRPKPYNQIQMASISVKYGTREDSNKESFLNIHTCLCIHPSNIHETRGGTPIQNQILDKEDISYLTLFKIIIV